MRAPDGGGEPAPGDEDAVGQAGQRAVRQRLLDQGVQRAALQGSHVHSLHW